MKPSVKSAVSSADKWARRAAAASGDYSTGVEQSPVDWAAATAGAQGSYDQGVQDAIARKAFSKGATAKGTAGWKRATTEKGPMRFSQGVGIGQPDYQAGVGPFLDVIAGTDLPPRGPRGAAGNYQRSQKLGE
ncbi:MAG TPA: hypothetical protein VIH11_07135, partial [Gemmatimonadaceae bacterium]